MKAFLHGNRNTDDTDALQALLDGEDVRYPDGEKAVMGELRPGTYRITRALSADGASDQSR